MANGHEARAIAVNEQLLRGDGESAFGFCGSVTPFDHPMAGQMIALAEKIAASSGCTGTLGIDFVVGRDTPWVIEVNPRFQGTVDTVEMACGCSLFQYHVNACAGTLPEAPEMQEYAARRILFADRDLTLKADLKDLAPIVSDIPWPGTFFEEEQAIVSVSGTGKTRDEALSMLDKNISTVRQYIALMDPVEEVLNNPAMRSYIHRLIGDEGLNLLEKFPKEGEHSDEDLAASTGINLNSVRHTLYTLYERRLAEYHRIKNNETGWLTYLWQLRIDHIHDAIRDDMEVVLDKLEHRVQFEEENDFFICKDCHDIFTFTQAIGGDFKCPNCEQPLSHFDNDMLVKALRERIDAMKKALGHA